ncbi:TetR family transcriptional regulator [Streptomyces bohaiensis]|uniref:TetR family transcriptional regulator n=2 Tax=Streptomyces bohaiensis TaxID=1431344 RepID=A0ABX1CD98_9ACTN|nr:TetR family transcriptional regulator [Streptomyces bohaiensis]
MPRMSAAERRRELVEATVRLMVREGVPAVTTRAVVAEAGMTLGTFHYCFASKRELLREVTAVLVDREARASLAAVEPGAGVRATVAGALEAFLTVVRERPLEQQALLELTQYALRTGGEEDLAVLQYDTYRRAAARVVSSVARSCGIVWTVPEPLVARTVVGMLDGLTVALLVDGDETAARQQVGVLADCLAGLTRPAPDGDA